MSQYRAILDKLFAAEKNFRDGRRLLSEATELLLDKSLSEITPEKANAILAAIRESDGAGDTVLAVTGSDEATASAGISSPAPTSTHECAIPDADAHDDPPSRAVTI